MVYMKVFGKGNAVSVRVSEYSSYLGFDLSEFTLLHTQKGHSKILRFGSREDVFY